MQGHTLEKKDEQADPTVSPYKESKPKKAIALPLLEPGNYSENLYSTIKPQFDVLANASEDAWSKNRETFIKMAKESKDTFRMLAGIGLGILRESKPFKQICLDFLKESKDIDYPIAFFQPASVEQDTFEPPFKKTIVNYQLGFLPTLYLAAAHGDLPLVKELIQAGAEVHKVSGNSVRLRDSMELVVSKNQQAFAVKMDPYIPATALSAATMSLQTDVVAELLKHLKDIDPTQALFNLQLSCNSETVKHFNPKLDKENYSKARCNIAAQLIKAGANIHAVAAYNTKEDDNNTKEVFGFHHILYDAMTAGDADLVALLLQHIENPAVLTTGIELIGYLNSTWNIVSEMIEFNDFSKVELIINMLLEKLEKLGSKQVKEMSSIFLGELISYHHCPSDSEQYNNLILHLARKGADPSAGLYPAINRCEDTTFQLCLNNGGTLELSRAYYVESRMRGFTQDSNKDLSDGCKNILKHFENIFSITLNKILENLNSFPQSTTVRFVSNSTPETTLDKVNKLRIDIQNLDKNKEQPENKENNLLSDKIDNLEKLLSEFIESLAKDKNEIVLKSFKEFLGCDEDNDFTKTFDKFAWQCYQEARLIVRNEGVPKECKI